MRDVKFCTRLQKLKCVKDLLLLAKCNVSKKKEAVQRHISAAGRKFDMRSPGRK